MAQFAEIEANKIVFGEGNVRKTDVELRIDETGPPVLYSAANDISRQSVCVPSNKTHPSILQAYVAVEGSKQTPRKGGG